jgi:hypothetical protein
MHHGAARKPNYRSFPRCQLTTSMLATTIDEHVPTAIRRRVLALLELGWSYRRIERETGVRRETAARYDPRRQSKAANIVRGLGVDER